MPPKKVGAKGGWEKYMGKHGEAVRELRKKKSVGSAEGTMKEEEMDLLARFMEAETTENEERKFTQSEYDRFFREYRVKTGDHDGE
jgi:hypothetical protein